VTHWNRPPDLSDLQEQRREPSNRVPWEGRWVVASFLAGLALVCALGVGTGIFDSGPTDLDVSSSFRAGFDRGAAESEAHWESAIDDAWWEGYSEGYVDEASGAPSIHEQMSQRFSWESGYEAGLESDEVSIADRYWEGWMEGFNRGWSMAAGTSLPAPAGAEAESPNHGGEP